jgi:hypothetical protein
MRASRRCGGPVGWFWRLGRGQLARLRLLFWQNYAPPKGFVSIKNQDTCGFLDRIIERLTKIGHNMAEIPQKR